MHYAFYIAFSFCEFLLSSTIQATFSELLPRPLMKDIVPWWFWNPLAWLCPCNFYQDGTLASILQDVIGKKYTLGTRVPEPLWWACLPWNRFLLLFPAWLTHTLIQVRTDLMLSVNATPSAHIRGVLFKAYSNLAEWSNASYFSMSQT